VKEIEIRTLGELHEIRQGCARAQVARHQAWDRPVIEHVQGHSSDSLFGINGPVLAEVLGRQNSIYDLRSVGKRGQ
jgi:hypothetical protein